ncbi:MAG: molybdopterin-dependent oxidoreductase, partial [Pseudomonadota bacterium]
NEASASVKKSSGKGGKASVPDILNRVGLDEEARKTFYEMVRVFTSSNNPLIIAGEGLTGFADQSGLVDLMNLAFLKGTLPEETSRLIILKRDGNSTGAWRLLLSSRKGMNGKGKWRAGIMLLGGEEALSQNLLDRLNGLDFLAVISPYFPDALADKAHVVVPKPLWIEESGTYTSLDGLGFGCKEKVLNPPEGVKESWQAMVDLASRTKFRPGFRTWDEIRKKVEEEMKLASSPIY